MELLAATSASDLIHEIYLECQETFLETQLHQLNQRHLHLQGCCLEQLFSLHTTAPCLPVLGYPTRELEVKSETRTQSQHRDSQGRQQRGILHLTEKEFIRKITWLILKESRSWNCISIVREMESARRVENRRRRTREGPESRGSDLPFLTDGREKGRIRHFCVKERIRRFLLG